MRYRFRTSRKNLARADAVGTFRRSKKLHRFRNVSKFDVRLLLSGAWKRPPRPAAHGVLSLSLDRRRCDAGLPKSERPRCRTRPLDGRGGAGSPPQPLFA
jgi:hypothetical protein